MNTSELLIKIRDVLMDDPDVSAFCNDNFLKHPCVMLGVDDNSLPEESDYPVIAIAGIRTVRGNAQNIKTWDVDLACGVVQEEIFESGGPGTQTKTLTGVLQAEELRELAEAAVINAGFAKISITGESGGTSFYPLFMSYTTVTVKSPAVRRKN